MLKPSSEGRLPIPGQQQPDVLLVMQPQLLFPPPCPEQAPLCPWQPCSTRTAPRGNKGLQRVCPAHAAPSPPRTSADLQPPWDQHGLSGASGCPANSGPGGLEAGEGGGSSTSVPLNLPEAAPSTRHFCPPPREGSRRLLWPQPLSRQTRGVNAGPPPSTTDAAQHRWKGLGLSPCVFHATQGEQQVPPLGTHTRTVSYVGSFLAAAQAGC